MTWSLNNAFISSHWVTQSLERIELNVSSNRGKMCQWYIKRIILASVICWNEAPLPLNLTSTGDMNRRISVQMPLTLSSSSLTHRTKMRICTKLHKTTKHACDEHVCSPRLVLVAQRHSLCFLLHLLPIVGMQFRVLNPFLRPILTQTANMILGRLEVHQLVSNTLSNENTSSMLRNNWLFVLHMVSMNLLHLITPYFDNCFGDFFNLSRFNETFWLCTDAKELVFVGLNPLF